MRDMILKKITFLNMEFGAKRSKEELLNLASQWAKDLQSERKEDISAALALYRQRYTRMPCLAQLLELLKEVRSSACKEIPQYTDGRGAPCSKENSSAWLKIINMVISGTEEEKARALAVGRRTRQILDAGRPVSVRDLEA